MEQVVGIDITNRLRALDRDRIAARIWGRDHTVWQEDPAECADRLGWLDVHVDMFARVPQLYGLRDTLLAEGFTSVVVLGMGGSSLAPEVLASSGVLPAAGLPLVVLDSTDPEQVAAVEDAIDVQRTAFVVSSKSGTTIETRSHLAYFWEQVKDGSHFIAVTDPGTALERDARALGFREVFVNPPDIGGRYSALSYFGLVPAAIAGVDLEALGARVGPMAQACSAATPIDANPGMVLGAAMAEAAAAGRDKLTLVIPRPVEALGHWVEQLVAESTGKQGKGILPVEGERLGAPAVYGTDRIFVGYGDAALGEIEAAGHPVVRLPDITAADLGAEFFRWEFATAVACHILGVNPFDQPNVQEAKELTGAVLAGHPVDSATPGLGNVLAAIRPGDYLALLAYLPRNAANAGRLAAVRHQLRDRYRVATTVGFGPRFLHSTGQLHKGGPNTGVFLQLVAPPEREIAIPGAAYGFAGLEAAQALGDLAALKAHGRRVARLTLEELEGALGLR